jgi:TRAP-type uncharacterized transport system substrate-binding protein
MSGAAWRWAGALAFVVCALVALTLVGPSIPNEIRLLAGPEGTTFHEFGLQYQEFMARHGVVVHLQPTAGSLENVAILKDADGPTAAFVQGIREPDDLKTEIPKGLQSLGTMSLQPLWVFVKKGMAREKLADLTGARIAAGRQGSDPRLLAVFLLQGEGLNDAVTFAPGEEITPAAAVQALRESEYGAFIASGAPDSPLIDRLLRAPELEALSIRRAAAFAIQYPFLEPVNYPEGAHDLRANIPNEDLRLLSARTQLVVAAPFPPALADLLLQAASEIHHRATPFSAAGEFPNAQTAAMPLNAAAERYYTEGPPRLQRILPFRLATWIDRILAALAAIATAAIAIFRIVPALLSLPFRLKVRVAYGELEALERSAAAGEERTVLLARLAEQDRATAAVKVPLKNLETEWFELRQYIHDMRDRLSAAQEA